MSQEHAVVSLPVKMMWAGHQGGGQSPAPSVDWVDGPDAMDATQFPSEPALAALARVVDWERHGLVWVRMGRKSTGGFGMGLKVSEAKVKGDTAVVTVEWREPAEGAYVTQMITSPCMALQLARGGYRKIVIEDHTGRMRARADIQAAQ